MILFSLSLITTVRIHNNIKDNNFPDIFHCIDSISVKSNIKMSISDDYPGCLATVVVSQVHWVEASNGFVPSGAIPGGRALHGEEVYIGRTRLLENHSEWTPGILVPSGQ